MSIVELLRENSSVGHYPRFKVDVESMGGGLSKVTLYEFEADYVTYIPLAHSICLNEDVSLVEESYKADAHLI